MLLEQVHFPEQGPNWGRIVMVSLTTIALTYIVFQMVNKPKIQSIPKRVELQNTDEPDLG